MNLKSLICAVIICLSVPREAFADWDYAQRCSQEKHNGDGALGRIKWAARCGYIKSHTLPFFLEEKLFPVFSSTGAPTDEWADCGSYGGVIGTCIWGCYTPDQTVMFAEREVPFIDAFEQRSPTVTSLADFRIFDGDSPRLTEQVIGEVTAGETSEDVYYITSSTGNRLAVSAKHPVVEASGKVITADQVRAGQTILLGRKGSLPIQTVEIKKFSGKLYNLSPESENTAHNILISDDFLTGSLRFQNEWAKDKSRLFLRSQLALDEDETFDSSMQGD